MQLLAARPLDPHQPPFRQHRRTASSPPHLSSCIATTPRQLHHSSPRSLQCVSPPSIASAPPPAASSPCNLRSTISACAATIGPPSSSTSAPSPCHAFFNVRSSCSSCLLPSSTQLVRVPRAERHLSRACLVLASRLSRASTGSSVHGCALRSSSPVHVNCNVPADSLVDIVVLHEVYNCCMLWYTQTLDVMGYKM